MLTILANAAMLLGTIVALYLMANAALVFLLLRNAEKLAFGLPVLKWVTLDDAKETGASEFWCRIILPSFHDAKFLEIRILEQIESVVPKDEPQFGFHTIQLFEFRLTERRRRRWSLRSLSFRGEWEPVPA